MEIPSFSHCQPRLSRDFPVFSPISGTWKTEGKIGNFGEENPERKSNFPEITEIWGSKNIPEKQRAEGRKESHGSKRFAMEKNLDFPWKKTWIFHGNKWIFYGKTLGFSMEKNWIFHRTQWIFPGCCSAPLIPPVIN